MANVATPSPFLSMPLQTPDAYEQQQALARQRALAQLLQSQQSPQYDQRGIIPRSAGIAQALQGAMSMLMQQRMQQQELDAQKQQYEKAQSMFGLGQQPQGPQQPQQSPLSNPNYGGGLGSLTGSPQSDFALYSTLGPQKYAELAAKRYEPTERMRDAQGFGMSPQEASDFYRAEQRQKGVINVAPGNTALIPGQDRPFVAPMMDKGIQGGYDQSGRFMAAPIPGASEAIASQAGAIKAAEARNSLNTVQTSTGAMVPVWGGDIGGGPPDSRRQPQRQMPQLPVSPQEAEAIRRDMAQNPGQQAVFSPTGQPNQGIPLNQAGLPPGEIPPRPPASMMGGFGQSTAAKVAAEKGVANDAEQLQDLFTKAEAAKRAIGEIHQQRGAFDAGVFAGWGADAKVKAATILNGLLGLDIMPEQLVNTEVFNKEAKSLAYAQLKSMFGSSQLSNADRESALQLMATSANNPQAIPKLLNILESGFRRQIEQSNKQWDYARSQGFPSMINRNVEMPPEYKREATVSAPPKNVAARPVAQRHLDRLGVELRAGEKRAIKAKKEFIEYFGEDAYRKALGALNGR